MLLWGCSLFGGPSRPQPSGGAYSGPPVTIDSMSDMHVVVMQAPTAGWTLEVDDERRRRGGYDAFITITTPNPAYSHAQVEVEQRLATRIRGDQAIAVYARVLDVAGKGRASGYGLAAQDKGSGG